MKLKKNIRQESIQRRLRAEPREWSVDEIAEMFGVSALTVRRDLDELAGKNLVLRTHGGCIVANRVADSPYYRKISENFSLKSQIGRKAAELIRPGQKILINDGSTCFHLASNLGGCGPLTVFTNSIAMISELRRFDGIKIYVLGGEYNPDLFYLLGGITELTLERLSFDIVFLGADAIGYRGECMCCEPEVARTTEMMLRCGRKRILLADHKKINAGGYVRYGTLEDFDMWITTDGLPNKMADKYESLINLVNNANCKS